jgi:hypothetical protein
MHTGFMGGLAGADAICNARAQEANLPGTYMAWLSTNQANGTPATRFTQSTLPYHKVDGVKVADNWADLVDGTLDSPINKTELGGAPPLGNTGCGNGQPSVWSATNSNGTLYNAGNTCSNWALSFGGGHWGRTSDVGSSWTTWCAGHSCAWQSPIYCFQQ